MKIISTQLKDRISSSLSWFTAILVIGAFAWLLVDVVSRGQSGLNWSFLTSLPQNAGRSGGIASVIVSTLLILLVCLLSALPLALGAALFLAGTQWQHTKIAMLLRSSLDMLAGIPSIVFGLFGGIFFCQILGLGYSILAGGLTLACMILPFLTRSIEEALRSVPDEYRLASAGLGFRHSTFYFHVLLPVALPGIVSGVVLGLGRALAETAALIFTSGYVMRMPESFLDSGRTIAVHIYDLAMNVTGGEQNAYVSALVLIIFLSIINISANRITLRYLHHGVSV